LNNATLPYVQALANHGIFCALRNDPHLMNGLNVHEGKITNKFVAAAHEVEYVSPAQAGLI
jgi:alanine dehydrogenase